MTLWASFLIWTFWRRVCSIPLTCIVSVMLCMASFASGFESSRDRALWYNPSAVTSLSCSSSLNKKNKKTSEQIKVQLPVHGLHIEFTTQWKMSSPRPSKRCNYCCCQRQSNKKVLSVQVFICAHWFICSISKISHWIKFYETHHWMYFFHCLPFGVNTIQDGCPS